MLEVGGGESRLTDRLIMNDCSSFVVGLFLMSLVSVMDTVLLWSIGFIGPSIFLKDRVRRKKGKILDLRP